MPIVFTQELVNGFSPKVKEQFRDYNLVFGQNLLNYNAEQSFHVRKLNKKENVDRRELISSLITPCIMNGKEDMQMRDHSVSQYYASEAMENAMDKANAIGSGSTNIEDYKYDLLLITKPEKNGREEIMGFIITRIGICELLPNIPALNIICSINPAVSKYLMYTYIKALQHLKLETGILELSFSYENTSGLCLYNKFGFREDSSLDDPQCFEEGSTLETLGMRANLKDKGYKDLDDVVLGKMDKLNIADGQLVCDKTRKSEIGRRGSNAQAKYIKNITGNRKFLRNSFSANNTEAIKQLLGKLNIKYDNNADALRTSIQRGKEMAENNQDITSLQTRQTRSTNKRKRGGSKRSTKKVKKYITKSKIARTNKTAHRRRTNRR
jgi:hypothetical protein